MSSTTKKYKYEGLPGFDRDPETGRYFPVPVDFKAVFGDHTENPTPNWKWRYSKKSNANCVQPVKYHKSETGVRKELFKVPMANWPLATDPNKETRSRTFSKGVRRSLAKTIPPSNDTNKTSKLKPEKGNISSIKSIEEQPDVMKLNSKEQCDQLILLSTPKTKSPVKEDNENCVKTPGSDDMMLEFLNLEQQYKTPKLGVDSPVSSVCNLFENKMILTNEKGELVNEEVTYEKIFNEIYRIIKLDEELCKDTANKIKEVMEQQIKHEQNLKLITTLFKNLHEGTKNSVKMEDKDINGNKENSLKRRSLRLQNKSSPKKHGVVGSPVILKSGDLRKTTLTKSLVHKYQKYQIESPRIKKALDMYNTTKNACNVLLSPKITRGQIVVTSAGTSLRNNLSLKIQQQCLMLQDTPKHK